MSESLVTLDANDPRRTVPPCPYFGTCGGCSLQHVGQDFYREWKQERVLRMLERTGVTVGSWETPVFLPHATRRRTSLAALKTAKGVILGYHAEKSHNIVDVNKCLVLTSELDAKVQALRPFLARLLPDKKMCDITLQYAGGLLDMVLTGPFKFGYEQHETLAEMAQVLDIARISWRAKDLSPSEILLNRKTFIKKFGNIVIELPPATFLQPSDEGEKALGDIVTRYLGDAKNIADLFSGCGTFSGQIAAQGKKVTAIDGDAAAIAALQKGAKSAGIQAERRNLFKNPLNAQELAVFDGVIFDPPRAGAKEQAREIAKTQISRVVAISCNPATFARDAKILQDGGYNLDAVTIVDQFIWSPHTEIAALFRVAIAH